MWNIYLPTSILVDKDYHQLKVWFFLVDIFYIQLPSSLRDPVWALFISIILFPFSQGKWNEKRERMLVGENIISYVYLFFVIKIVKIKGLKEKRLGPSNLANYFINIGLHARPLSKSQWSFTYQLTNSSIIEVVVPTIVIDFAPSIDEKHTRIHTISHTHTNIHT